MRPKKQKETVTRKKTRVQPLKFTGAIGASRTRDPLLRRQMLYPTELQPQVITCLFIIAIPEDIRKHTGQKGCLPFCYRLRGKFSAVRLK